MLVLDVSVGCKNWFCAGPMFQTAVAAVFVALIEKKSIHRKALFIFNQVTKSQINLCVDNFAEKQRVKFVHSFRIVSLLNQDQKHKDDIRAAQLA